MYVKSLNDDEKRLRRLFSNSRGSINVYEASSDVLPAGTDKSQAEIHFHSPSLAESTLA